MESAAYRLDDVVRAATGANPTTAEFTGASITLTLTAEAWRQPSMILLVAARSGLSEEDGAGRLRPRRARRRATLQPDRR